MNATLMNATGPVGALIFAMIVAGQLALFLLGMWLARSLRRRGRKTHRYQPDRRDPPPPSRRSGR